MRTPVAGNLVFTAMFSTIVAMASDDCTWATTITFTGHEANSDVTEIDEGSYGSRVAEETTDFITSDGSGPTPNIALIWSTATGPRADIWEFHNAHTFFYLDPGETGDPPRSTGVAQLDVNFHGDIPPADPTITFVPDAGYAVTIRSFRIGHATDLKRHEGTNAWKITLTRVSDKKILWSHTTDVLKAGDTEKVKVDFTGEPGEQYRLRFDRGLANHPRAGIDDLSFSQSDVQPQTRDEFAKVQAALKRKIANFESDLLAAQQVAQRADQMLNLALKAHETAHDDERSAAEELVAIVRQRALEASEQVADLDQQLGHARKQFDETSQRLETLLATQRPQPTEPSSGTEDK